MATTVSECLSDGAKVSWKVLETKRPGVSAECTASKAELKALQDETGYFQDLQVYIKDEDGKAYRPNESDAFQA